MIKMLYDRVLIRRKPPEETVRGGIVIPDIAKGRPQEGEVVAVGGGKITNQWDYEGTGYGEQLRPLFEPMPVKPGDQVLFSKYAGIEIRLPDDDGDYIIVRAEDILGVTG